ncbi:MaoC family dehydratase [Paraferrimonas sedimenticola]|uniref:Dehydratase n=1 Tax=Paraferrimonas sedimenticola TaxID=375674 RepID=A0AA37W236_9GAMM|nr:MaoC/PaaZ C-terminal domain-containing protein [Paraferrimonas sedimenticola]GLP97288.1 dehydratase [Paraferrimonas sedimenticola]
MSQQIQLTKLPSLFSVYRRILFARKPGWDGKPLPEIQVNLSHWQADQAKVNQYCHVCGFEANRDILPPTYLYTQVFRLHAIIFTDAAITFPLWGMIHLKNTIQQFRDVATNENLRLSCSLSGSSESDAGLEFELVSKAFAGDELVWQAHSTYLYKAPGGKRKRARPPRASDMPWEPVGNWPLPQDLGRAYAKASGDYNLIHIHPLLAKQFGFDKILAHGMWSKARCVAELPQAQRSGACEIGVEFKLPLFLPAKVSFGYQIEQDQCRFELRDERGRRPHLVGWSKPLSSD